MKSFTETTQNIVIVHVVKCSEVTANTTNYEMNVCFPQIVYIISYVLNLSVERVVYFEMNEGRFCTTRNVFFYLYPLLKHPSFPHNLISNLFP